MPIKFTQTCYSKSLQSQLSEEDLRKCKFRYGKVTRIQFNETYASTNEGLNASTRKKLAAFAALITVAKAVYHLAITTILIGGIHLLKGNSKPLVCGVFYLVRDGQGLFGILLSIFNDRLGLYHAQESLFQKSCYDYYLTPNSSPKQTIPPGSSTQPNRPSSAPPKVNKTELADELSTIKSMSDLNLQETNLIALADKYYQQGNLKEAFKILNDALTCYKTENKEDLLLKIARQHVKQDQPEDALKITKTFFTHRTKDQETVILEIAEYHLNQGDAGKARKIVNDAFFCHQHAAKDAFLQKILLHKATPFPQAAPASIHQRPPVQPRQTPPSFKPKAPSVPLNVDAELKKVDSIRDSSEKENRLLELAENCYEHGNLDKALKIVKDGTFYGDRRDASETLILNIAEQHFIKNELDKALKIVKDSCFYGDRRDASETFILKIAEQHFIKNDLVKALKIVKDSSFYGDRRDASETFILKIAKQHFKQNELDKALKIIKDFSFYGDQRDAVETFILNIAEEYFAKNELENARKILKNFTFFNDKEALEAFVLKIAEKYWNANQPDQALETVKECSFDCEKEALEEFVLKIVRHYLNQNQPDKALKTIKETSFFSKREESQILLFTIASEFWKNQNAAYAIECVSLITISLLFDQIIERQINRSISAAEVRTAFSNIPEVALQIAATHAGQIKLLLLQGKLNEARSILEKAVTENAHKLFAKSAQSNQPKPPPSANRTAPPPPPKTSKIPRYAFVPPLASGLTPPKDPVLKNYFDLCVEAKPDSYHTVFGLKPSFTKEDLQEAFKKVVRIVHPDKSKDEPKDTMNALFQFTHQMKASLAKGYL